MNSPHHATHASEMESTGKRLMDGILNLIPDYTTKRQAERIFADHGGAPVYIPAASILLTHRQRDVEAMVKSGVRSKDIIAFLMRHHGLSVRHAKRDISDAKKVLGFPSRSRHMKPQ